MVIGEKTSRLTEIKKYKLENFISGLYGEKCPGWTGQNFFEKAEHLAEEVKPFIELNILSFNIIEFKEAIYLSFLKETSWLTVNCNLSGIHWTIASKVIVIYLVFTELLLQK